jgi:hypothetical protein
MLRQQEHRNPWNYKLNPEGLKLSMLELLGSILSEFLDFISSQQQGSKDGIDKIDHRLGGGRRKWQTGAAR